MEVVHVTFALEVEDVEEIEEAECEYGTRLLPSRGKPPLPKELSQMTVTWNM
jgi:hypothetical protein